MSASIRSLLGMESLVFFEQVSPCERFTACGTDVTSLTRVPKLVPLQVGNLGEGYVTLGALMWSHCAVHTLALTEVRTRIAMFLQLFLTL